jgi:hypothetical protein
MFDSSLTGHQCYRIKNISMIRPLFLLGFGLLCTGVAQAQFVTYRFTDGSVVVHPVINVRSTDFEAGAMRVFLWDGTTYEWGLSSLANYQFGDISTEVPEQGPELTPVLVYPNPSSGEVRIGVTVSGSSEVVVEVMDLRGALVRTVHSGPLPDGARELVWDGHDTHGQPAAAGTYVIRVVQGPRTAVHQLILQY